MDTMALGPQHELEMAIMQHQPEALVRALSQGARLDGGPRHNPKLITPGQQLVYLAMSFGSAKLLEAAEGCGQDLAPYLEQVSVDQLISHCRKSARVLKFLLARWPSEEWRLPREGGNSLLHVMVNVGGGRHVKTLVDQGLAVNAVNEAGQTPLHLARSRQAIRALLGVGARRAVMDKAGNTPLQGAVKRLMNVPRRRSGMTTLSENDLEPVWLLAREGGLAEDPKARLLAQQLARLRTLGMPALATLPMDDIWQQVDAELARGRRNKLMTVAGSAGRQGGVARRM